LKRLSPESVNFASPFPTCLAVVFPAIAAWRARFLQKRGLDATIELLFPVTRTYEALRDGQLISSAVRRMPALRFRDWVGCKLLWRALAEHVLVPGRAQRSAHSTRDLRSLKGLASALRPGPRRSQAHADRRRRRSRARDEYRARARDRSASFGLAQHER